MRENSRSLIPTALICVFLLLVLALGAGVVGIMYVHSRQLQTENDKLNAAMAAQQVNIAMLQTKNAELEAVNKDLRARLEMMKNEHQQLRAESDVLRAEGESEVD